MDKIEYKGTVYLVSERYRFQEKFVQFDRDMLFVEIKNDGKCIASIKIPIDDVVHIITTDMYTNKSTPAFTRGDNSSTIILECYEDYESVCDFYGIEVSGFVIKKLNDMLMGI
jgi:hypothetical protein